MAQQYPFLFTFLDKVEGNGYMAHVEVHGRLLAVDEGEDGWWMYGVEPGGVAAHGKTRTEAYTEFRKSVMRVLFDFAVEANGEFHAFRKAARQFFDEKNVPTEKEWQAARDEVRAGRVEIEGLRRETNESPRRIEITHKKTFAATGNAIDPAESVAA